MSGFRVLYLCFEKTVLFEGGGSAGDAGITSGPGLRGPQDNFGELRV